MAEWVAHCAEIAPRVALDLAFESYNYKLCMKGKGGGVFLMVFEIINSY